MERRYYNARANISSPIQTLLSVREFHPAPKNIHFLIDFCLSAEYNIILWKTVRYARYCIFRNTERHGIL